MALKQAQTRPMPRNVPLEIWYRKKLMASLRSMSKEVELRVGAQYKRNSPEMAVDASPANDMNALLRHMRYKWKNDFAKLAKTVSKLFAKRAERDASTRLKTILKESGFTVDFKLTPRLSDILQASVAENVSLIKSIQSQYFDQVETIVMQAVKDGRDLGHLREELRKRYAITGRRATVIARDQTNKANAAVSRARTLETGLTKATWVHIGGKYTNRATHVKMHGQEFDLREGLYDSKVKRKVLPGELINCSCSYKVVVPKLA